MHSEAVPGGIASLRCVARFERWTGRLFSLRCSTTVHTHVVSKHGFIDLHGSSSLQAAQHGEPIGAQMGLATGTEEAHS